MAIGLQGSPRLGGGFYQTSVNQGIADYGDVLAGYQQAIGAQQGAQAGIQSGYSNLQGQVANTLGYGGTPWGVAAPAAQSIADVYAQRQGQATQQLINSGLGNSTVLQSSLRGNMLDTQKAYAGLGANLAQTYAGYQSNLGLAGLNQQAQAAQQQNQTRLAQLGYMGTRYNEGIAPIPGYQYGGGGGVRSGGISNLGAQAPSGGYNPAGSYRPYNTAYGAPGAGSGYAGTQSNDPYAGPPLPNQGFGFPEIPPLNTAGGYSPGGDAGGYDWGGYSPGQLLQPEDYNFPMAE